jgi:hypothetical protein
MRLRWVCVALLGVMGATAQESSGSITGTVVDAVGLAIPGATVAIVSPIERETTGGSTGEFTLNGLAPGMYKLRIRVAGFLPKELGVQIEDVKEMSLGMVRLDLPAFPPCLEDAKTPRISEKNLPGGGRPRIFGNTRGERGGVLRNFTITLLAAGTSKVIANTTTDENGDFVFVGVKSGRYDIEGSSKGFTLTKVPNLRARKGRELKVFLTWTEGQICL